MRWLRWITLVYWTLLSVLLLIPNPWALLGFLPPLGGGSGPGKHLAAFLILGLLVGCCRWPGRRMAWAGVLVGYAVIVELAQTLVPQRTVELNDLLENFAGLALAAALCWAGRRVAKRRRTSSQ